MTNIEELYINDKEEIIEIENEELNLFDSLPIYIDKLIKQEIKNSPIKNDDNLRSARYR